MSHMRVCTQLLLEVDIKPTISLLPHPLRAARDQVVAALYQQSSIIAFINKKFNLALHHADVKAALLKLREEAAMLDDLIEKSEKDNKPIAPIESKQSAGEILESAKIISKLINELNQVFKKLADAYKNYLKIQSKYPQEFYGNIPPRPRQYSPCMVSTNPRLGIRLPYTNSTEILMRRNKTSSSSVEEKSQHANKIKFYLEKDIVLLVDKIPKTSKDFYELALKYIAMDKKCHIQNVPHPNKLRYEVAQLLLERIKFKEGNQDDEKYKPFIDKLDIALNKVIGALDEKVEFSCEGHRKIATMINQLQHNLITASQLTFSDKIENVFEKFEERINDFIQPKMRFTS